MAKSIGKVLGGKSVHCVLVRGHGIDPKHPHRVSVRTLCGIFLNGFTFSRSPIDALDPRLCGNCARARHLAVVK